MEKLEVIEQREVLGKDFKIYGTLEDPLFLAGDVADWIEHSNARMMLKKIDEEEKVLINADVCDVNNAYTTSRARKTQEVWALTEFGIYEVLMQSRKPIAKQFKKQVKHILKEIRLKGYYLSNVITEEQLEEAKQEAEDLGAILKTVKNNNRRLTRDNKKLTKQLEEEREKNKNIKLYTCAEVAQRLGLHANEIKIALEARGIIKAIGVINNKYVWEIVDKRLIENNLMLPHVWNYQGDIYKDIKFTSQGMLRISNKLIEWGLL